MSDRDLIGGDIIRLITAGMYDNPLVIYREYLQNAADSIASRNCGDGSVLVDINTLNSQITITDNGLGLSPTEAAQRLLPIGNSLKTPGIDRGLRGVGRLAALAFAEELHFTTRSKESDPVIRVTWDGRALRGLELQSIDAKTVVEACTSISTIPTDNWPDRFFQVSINGVSRHAAPALLNEDVVRQYISEVCPVPLDSSFPLASDLMNFLKEHSDYFVLKVCLNDNSTPIVRPYGCSIPLTEHYSAAYERLETRIIPQLDHDAPAAILWLAHTPYAGSISRRLGIRGLRARIGNIQIGSDNVFEHLFHEARFNGWCVGEIHIVDKRIVPNGRREYFETGPHLRNLENHIGAIAQEISLKCRDASSHRNKLRKFQTAKIQAEWAQAIANLGYLHKIDASELLSREYQRVKDFELALELIDSVPKQVPDTEEELTLKPDCVSDNNPDQSMSRIPTESLNTLKSIFGTIVKTMSPDSAYDLIQTIINDQYPEASIKSDSEETSQAEATLFDEYP